MITKELLIELAKEQAPEAKCVAIDKNINIYAYPDQPILDTDEWLDDEKESTQIFLPDEIWQESLVEIPQDDDEWHDLTWARDRMLEGKKVTFKGQPENIKYFYYEKGKFFYDFRDNITRRIGGAWIHEYWKLYEESKPELVKGQRVLVSDTPNGYKLRRIFSHMSGDLYYCFTQGRDEWTSEGKTFAWKHYKAWEQIDEEVREEIK